MNSGRIARQAIIGLLVLIVGLLVWSITRGPEDPVEDGPITGPAGKGGDDTQPRIPRKMIPEDGAPGGTTLTIQKNPLGLPDSPAAGIEQLRKEYSGRELGSKLWKAGKYYARMGPESAKDYIMNVPPGSAGQSALTGAVHGISPEYAPEIFSFMIDNAQAINEEMVGVALFDLIDMWAGKEFEASWDFVSQQGTAEQRASWLEAVLAAGSPEEIFSKVESVEDPSLRRKLLASPSSLKAHVNNGRFEIFGELDSVLQDRTVSRRLLTIVEESNHGPAAIGAMHKAQLSDPGLVATAVARWAARDTNAALEFLTKTGDPQLTSDAIERSYRTILKYDPEAAAAWVEKIRDPKRRASIQAELGKKT